MTEQSRPGDSTGWRDAEAPGTPAEVAATPPVASSRSARPAVRRTRTSGLWVGLTLGAVVLVLLLVFILQNLVQVPIYFFGASGQLPLGVALLLAAVAGVLIVAIPGSGRILQLRRAARRQRR